MAIALIGLALLTAAALLVAHPRAVVQIEAQRQLLVMSEATIEGVRGGLLPLESGDVTQLLPLPTPESVEACRVQIDVQEVAGSDGLYRLKVVASGRVLGEEMKRVLETLVWSPS